MSTLNGKSSLLTDGFVEWKERKSVEKGVGKRYEALHHALKKFVILRAQHASNVVVRMCCQVVIDLRDTQTKSKERALGNCVRSRKNTMQSSTEQRVPSLLARM